MFRRLLGMGTDPPPEFIAVDVENHNAENREMTITFCMQAQIDKGKTLGFRMSSALCNISPQEHRNPLFRMRDSLNPDQDQRIVIRDVERLHYYNELGGELVFALEHVFDGDPATDAIRKRLDTALAGDTNGLRVASRTPAPASVVNNNNTTSGQSSYLDPATDSETHLMVEGDSGNAMGFGNVSSDRVLDELDSITARGRHCRSNRAERDNAIELGAIKPNTTWVGTEILYRASLTDTSIRWFAGQDYVVADLDVKVTLEGIL